MNTILDLLWLRQPKLEYQCPPICEVLFSATGAPIVIVSHALEKQLVTGLCVGGTDNFSLHWNPIPGALCYSVYQATTDDPTGPYEIILDCVAADNDPNCSDCPPGKPGVDLGGFGTGCYRVSAVTLDGETELSEPNCDVGNPLATDCNGNTPVPPPVECDAEVIDWATVRVPANDGNISESTFNAACDFMNSLKAAGLRSKIIRLNLFAGDDINAAVVPLIVDAGAALDSVEGAGGAGSLTYSEPAGITTTNVNPDEHLGTGLNIASSMLIDDLHIGAYCLDTGPINDESVMGGETGASSWLQLRVSASGLGGTGTTFECCQTSGFAQDAGDTSNGFYVGNRASSAATDGKIYHNGVLLASSTTNGGSLPNIEMFVLGMNFGGAGQAYRHHLGLYTVGYSMTPAEQVTFYNIVQAFQTALGRAV